MLHKRLRWSNYSSELNVQWKRIRPTAPTSTAGRRLRTSFGIFTVSLMILTLYVLRNLVLRLTCALKALSSQRYKIAVIHELLPHLDQGGNVRMHRILETLALSGYDVTLYTRENGRENRYFSLGWMKIKVVNDGMNLNALQQTFDQYDILLSSLWFWRAEADSSVRTIPSIIDEWLFFSADPPTHVIITDDIHHLRCAKLMSVHWSEHCERIMIEEKKLLERSDIFKLFITNEDLQYALRATLMPEGSGAVLPYIIEERHNFAALSRRPRKVSACELLYFGNAHPANVQALYSLFDSAAEVILDFASLERGVNCVLTIAGDQKWHSVLQSVNSGGLKDLGIQVKVAGFVQDIDKLMASSTFIMIPVTVGGTGVSSKVLKCIESEIPFSSTAEGKRGFPCDDKCHKLFFHDNVADMISETLSRAVDQHFIQRAKDKLREIHSNMRIGDDVTNLLKIAVESARVNKLKKSETGEAATSAQASKTCAHVEQHRKYCHMDPVCHKIDTLKCANSTPFLRPILSVFTTVKGTKDELQFIENFVEDAFEQDLTPIGSLSSQVPVLLPWNYFSSLCTRPAHVCLSW